MAGRKHIFHGKDYLALGLSIMLAFGVWLVHNLSKNYSGLVRCAILPICELDGHSDRPASSAEFIARCEMNGFELLSYRHPNPENPVRINVTPDDMHHLGGDRFYMTAPDITRYFHDIFSDRASLEYYVSDTLFFIFPSLDYKKVPVNPVLSQSFKPQYMATGDFRVVPDSVLVYGEPNLLKSISGINTIPLHLSNISSDLYGEVKLESIQGLRLSADKVEYSLPVTRYVEQEIKMPVRAVNAPRNVILHIFPMETLVRVRVPFPSRVSLDDVFPAVDYADFENSVNGNCIGKLYGLPGGVLSADISPEVFDCLVQVQ